MLLWQGLQSSSLALTSSRTQSEPPARLAGQQSRRPQPGHFARAPWRISCSPHIASGLKLLHFWRFGDLEEELVSANARKKGRGLWRSSENLKITKVQRSLARCARLHVCFLTLGCRLHDRTHNLGGTKVAACIRRKCACHPCFQRSIAADGLDELSQHTSERFESSVAKALQDSLRL